MKPRLSWFGVCLLGIAAVSSASSAQLVAQTQSLGDAAGRAAEQRSSAPTPAKVYTNTDQMPAPCEPGVSGVGSGGIESLASSGAPGNSGGASDLPREEIVRRATPAVVTIRAGSVAGTGFFVAPGLVLTNKHVISGGGSLEVVFFDGRTSRAAVSGVSQNADLALVAVEHPPSPQPTLALDSVRNVQVGEEVLAIGSPLGMLQSTVTRGIVSAIRTVSGLAYVQTDAAINPGNSGGPLMDQKGRVIAITTMKFSAGESLGFAIAADYAVALLGSPITTAVAHSGCGANGDRDKFARDASLDIVLNHGESSAAETARDKGMAAFEQTVQTFARQADVIDTWWQRYQTDCAMKPAHPVPDGRDWFGVWSVPVVPTTNETGAGPAAIDKEALPQCRAERSRIVTGAAPIRTGMGQAEEKARRAGISPGAVRDIRRRYRMDWADWDR